MGGVEGNDLNQGEVGNCWFVAACASLALEKKLWNHVVPNVADQVISLVASRVSWLT